MFNPESQDPQKETPAKNVNSQALTLLPKDLRPREKLLTYGASSLSEVELLAIVLRTGVSGMNVLSLAQSLLQSFGSLRKIFTASQEDLCAHKGLGGASYALLQAMSELSRRSLLESLEKGNVLTSPRQTKDYLLSHLQDRQREVFLVMYLDSQHRLISQEILFEGTIDAASIYPREVIKQAVKHNAAALMFAHNHPSGVAEPSEADKRITKRLVDAANLIDVRVLDHFVVGDCCVVSFAERGWI